MFVIALDFQIFPYKFILNRHIQHGTETLMALRHWIQGSTERSNSYYLKPIQSEILRKLCNALDFISNLTLHTDQQVPIVRDVAVSPL